MVQHGDTMRETWERFLNEAMTLRALPPPRPTADVYETVDGDAFVIEVAAPGFLASQIIIEATSDSVTVSMMPKRARSGTRNRKIQQNPTPVPMSRVVQFPREIDTDNVRATLEHGIMNIYIPKAVASARRVIPIRKSV